MSSSPESARSHYEPDELDLERLVFARDRAAAALDRLEAAVAHRRASAYLQQTYRDELTGALQREAGRERLTQEVERGRREGTPVVMAFVDVVGLKAVNDTHGHAAGDLVLAAVGAGLIAAFRSYDLVVRCGGDEFVCCLPGRGVHLRPRRTRGGRSPRCVRGPGG